jgi:hypothetical protein
MKCKDLQHLLYSARTDELNPAEWEALHKHLVECEACSALFQKVSNADRILARIKDAAPRIRNEHALTESIIAEIVSAKRSVAVDGADTFLDRLNVILSQGIIRFACGLIIIMCGMSYVSMEYNDTKAIANLEQRLGEKSESNRATIFQREINILNFLHELYNLSNGSTSSVELTNTLVLMKKADVHALLNGYKTLDEVTRTRLDDLWNKYKKEESSLTGSEKNREEVTALRKEIERLKKELEQNNLKKELP